MKRFIVILYAALYIGIAVSFSVVEYTSIKVGWPWISTLVVPMGWVFLAVNIPLAAIAVGKIGHVVYLHSAEHHAKAMKRIEAIKVSPSPTLAIQEENFVKDEMLSQQAGTHVPLSQNSLSQSVPLSQGVKSDNVKVAAYLVDNPLATIRQVARNTGESRSNVGRTPAWKNR